MAGIRLRTFSYFGLITALIGTALLVRQSDPFVVRALRLAAFDSYRRIQPRTYDPEVPIRMPIRTMAMAATSRPADSIQTTACKPVRTLAPLSSVLALGPVLAGRRRLRL